MKQTCIICDRCRSRIYGGGFDNLRRRRSVPELHQHAGLAEAAQAV